MAALVQAGEARTLEEAYAAARRVRGLDQAEQQERARSEIMREQQDAARAAAERRRSEVAAAKNAGTPRTTGAPTRATGPADGPVKDIGALLEEGYDQLMGAGR